MIKKSKLAIMLSNFETFKQPKAELEQYAFDGQSASEMLWDAHQLGDIENKVVGDFGCGTGILGIGALLLGAKFVYFIDTSEAAVIAAKRNLKKAEEDQELNLKDKASFLIGDISMFKKKVDTVLQNPPFGTQKEHADRIFLEKAIENAKITYSVHKTSTSDFIRDFSKKNGGNITHIFRLEIQLKQTMKWHKSNIRRVNVSAFRIEKIK
ncbi:MAG: METTL5 family protein [Nanoarchaeota archaeon]|nr:METTL5 family protein [Nanoarchaeota archaeon]